MNFLLSNKACSKSSKSSPSTTLTTEANKKTSGGGIPSNSLREPHWKCAILSYSFAVHCTKNLLTFVEPGRISPIIWHNASSLNIATSTNEVSIQSVEFLWYIWQILLRASLNATVPVTRTHLYRRSLRWGISFSMYISPCCIFKHQLGVEAANEGLFEKCDRITQSTD